MLCQGAPGDHKVLDIDQKNIFSPTEIRSFGTTIKTCFKCLITSPTHLFVCVCVFLSGILRTAVPDMDRETQDQYLVLLQAKDMGGHLGGLSGTTTVTVKLTDVNDNPPRFTQSELLSRRPRRVKNSCTFLDATYECSTIVECCVKMNRLH